MTARLKHYYFLLLLPALAGFVAAWAALHVFDLRLPTDKLPAAASPVLFFLAVAFGAAGPVFYRTVYAYAKRGVSNINEDDFFRFERRQIIIVMAAPYLTLILYAFHLTPFYVSAGILVTLYSIYYIYPSERRIGFDMSLFRLAKD